jgi:hypothetical protein
MYFGYVAFIPNLVLLTIMFRIAGEAHGIGTLLQGLATIAKCLHGRHTLSSEYNSLTSTAIVSIWGRGHTCVALFLSV